MNNHHFMMSYSGALSQQSIRSLLSVAEKKLGVGEADAAVRKKVFNVMVECLQSVCRGEASGNDSVFMLGKDDQQYILYSCFYTSQQHVERLCFFLDQIESWGIDRLKEEHRHLLADVFENRNSSALFSLIDITLKSKNRLGYDYQEESNGRVFFSLKTIIKHGAEA